MKSNDMKNFQFFLKYLNVRKIKIKIKYSFLCTCAYASPNFPQFF